MLTFKSTYYKVPILGKIAKHFQYSRICGILDDFKTQNTAHLSNRQCWWDRRSNRHLVKSNLSFSQNIFFSFTLCHKIPGDPFVVRTKGLSTPSFPNQNHLTFFPALWNQSIIKSHKHCKNCKCCPVTDDKSNALAELKKRSFLWSNMP